MPGSYEQIDQTKYEVLEKLREGGMGAIFKVRHRALDQIRVVKVLLSDFSSDAHFQERFLQEARLACRMIHPNIAQIHDFHLDPSGTASLVMEYIEGFNLAQVLGESGPLETDLALEVSVQSLRAIDYLHGQDLIHRDISPDNLMLTRDTKGRPLVKLIDLGIAKPLQREKELTATGLFLGKLNYASPEQFGGSDSKAVVGPASDLYSFGVVLYQLLTGELPFQGTDSQIMAGHLFHSPRVFEEVDKDRRVPDDLRRVVLQALAKDPADRFANAEEFSQVLQGLHSGPRGDADPTRRSDPSSPTRRDAQPLEEVAATEMRANSFEVPGGKERIRTLLAGAEKLAELGQIEAATQQLETILSIQPNYEEAVRLLARIKDVQLAPILGEAARLFLERRFGQALECLEKAREIDPGSERVRRRIQEVKDAERGHRAEQQRLREGQALKDRIAQALDREEVGEAAALLDSETARTANARGFETLRRRLSEMQSRLAYSQANELAEQARQLASAGGVDAALDLCREALEVAPRHLAATELLAKIERQQESTRRAAEMTRAVADIEALARGGDLDSAQESLRRALEEFGNMGPLQSLQSRLAEDRRQREKRERVRGLVARSEALEAEGDRVEAIAALEQACTLDPENEPVRRLLDRLRSLHIRSLESTQLVPEAVVAIPARVDPEIKAQEEPIPLAERQAESKSVRKWKPVILAAGLLVIVVVSFVVLRSRGGRSSPGERDSVTVSGGMTPVQEALTAEESIGSALRSGEESQAAGPQAQQDPAGEIPDGQANDGASAAIPSPLERSPDTEGLSVPVESVDPELEALIARSGFLLSRGDLRSALEAAGNAETRAPGNAEVLSLWFQIAGSARRRALEAKSQAKLAGAETSTPEPWSMAQERSSQAQAFSQAGDGRLAAESWIESVHLFENAASQSQKAAELNRAQDQRNEELEALKESLAAIEGDRELARDYARRIAELAPNDPLIEEVRSRDRQEAMDKALAAGRQGDRQLFEEVWRQYAQDWPEDPVQEFYKSEANSELEAAEAAALQGARVREDVDSSEAADMPGSTSAPIEVARGAPAETFEDPKAGVKFRLVPAGEFRRGCTKDDFNCFDDEKPSLTVKISSPFYLAATETTNSQFLGCVEQGACRESSYQRWLREEGRRDHPVTDVTWTQAHAFCDWVGGRLPTEAEWEYSARGGASTFRFPWGNDIDSSRANYTGSGDQDRWLGTSPVASFAANGFGLSDMAGNVREWVADWYQSDYYVKGARVDPQGSKSGGYRVIRDGSWYDDPMLLRVSFRHKRQPRFTRDWLGFRCASDGNLSAGGSA